MRVTPAAVVVVAGLAGRAAGDPAPTAPAAPAAPALTAADRDAFWIGPHPAWFLLGGVTTGGTVALADRGPFVGGELSVARLDNGTYFGAYADGYYAWGVDGTYVTGGVEAGHSLLGLDGGVALRFADGGTQVGAAGRLSVGVGAVALYLRYAHFFDARTADDALQVGVLVKLPLITFGASGGG